MNKLSNYLPFLNYFVFESFKGKYHENLLSFQNPKMFVCQQKQRNNALVIGFPEGGGGGTPG